MPLDSLSVLETGAQLVTLLNSATTEYFGARATFMGECIGHRNFCVVCFNGSDNGAGKDSLKLCVDFIHFPDPLTSLRSVYLDVCFQYGPNQVPKAVCGLDLDDGHGAFVPPVIGILHDNYKSLLEALDIGVAAVEPATFLSMLLLTLLSHHDILDYISTAIENQEDNGCVQKGRKDHLQLLRDISAVLCSWGKG